MKRCHNCGNEWKGLTRPGNRETCARCGEDLHCCLNCGLHDVHKPYECREPDADPVRRKERYNFCDYFKFRDGPSSGHAPSDHPAGRAAFDRLFKK